MSEENLYELLQVRPAASPRVIQAAYRRLMLLHHPDRNPGADALEMSQRLNRAYEILSDPERRAAYDWELSGEPGEPPGGAVPGSPSPTAPGGFPKSVWLAGAGVAVAIVIVVSAIAIRAGSDGLPNDNQTGQTIAPVSTPNIAPPIVPRPTAGDSGAMTAPTATPNPSFLFESGEAFIRNGDFVQAIEEFTRAIDLIPSYGYGYRVRGDSYFQLAQYQLAIQDYGTAISLDPNDKSAYSGRGRAQYRLGQYQLAIDNFDRAVQIDSRFASAYNRRGLAHAQLRELQLSKLDNDRACALDSQYCAPLLSVVPTATPTPTATPAPTATPGPTATQVRGRREIFLFPSSTISMNSNATLKVN